MKNKPTDIHSLYEFVRKHPRKLFCRKATISLNYITKHITYTTPSGAPGKLQEFTGRLEAAQGYATANNVDLVFVIHSTNGGEAFIGIVTLSIKE